MIPFAVDANAIALFQKERVTKEPADGMAAISAISASNCIALDAEKLCLQEWMNAARGSFPFALSDWVGDMLAVGKIRYFPLAPNTCRKKLLSYGLPPDDHKWIRLAVGCRGNILVTGDVDFFEPTMKKANAEAKKKIRQNNNGKCSKSLRKDFNVEVFDVAMIPQLLKT